MTDAICNEAARLQFLSDWRIIQRKHIRPGEKLIIEYDTERLPSYRDKWRGADDWIGDHRLIGG
jgi:hypothetical protein